jgi:hypothetical protein
MRMHRLELHASERPHALHMQMVANFNRDKKKSKPFSIDQFYLYQPVEHKNLPNGKFGAAAIELISRQLFPFFALFCYKDLVQLADQTPPELLCYQSDVAILLAPEIRDDQMFGLLIAVEEAGGTHQIMHSPCGKSLTTIIPEIKTKVIAKEDVFLPILALKDS